MADGRWEMIFLLKVNGRLWSHLCMELHRTKICCRQMSVWRTATEIWGVTGINVKNFDLSKRWHFFTWRWSNKEGPVTRRRDNRLELQVGISQFSGPSSRYPVKSGCKKVLSEIFGKKLGPWLPKIQHEQCWPARRAPARPTSCHGFGLVLERAPVTSWKKKSQRHLLLTIIVNLQCY